MGLGEMNFLGNVFRGYRIIKDDAHNLGLSKTFCTTKRHLT